MDPIDPSAGFGASADPQYQQYPDPQYQQPQYEGPQYEQPQYEQPGYGQPAYADDPSVVAPPAPGRNRGRTAVLSLIALLALGLVILAAFLVLGSRGGSDDSSTAGAASSSSSSSAATSSSSKTTSSSTESSTTSSSKPAAGGTVTYELSGSGNLVGLRYTGRSGDQVVAATGVPWSVRTEVSGGTAQVSGIVVGGRVTCTITVDGEVVSTATSNGGTLSCRAPLE